MNIHDKCYLLKLLLTTMTSVTSRVREVVQPKNGFLDPRSLTHIRFNDGYILGKENVHASNVGTAVDYLSRLVSGDTPGESFRISLLGAFQAGRYEEAQRYLAGITGLDDYSIENACRLVSFDSYYRSGTPMKRQPVDIVVDGQTCDNIRIMVNRTQTFLEKYGPVVKNGFTMEGGYTGVIDSGDGDILTSNGLWDLKTTKTGPDKTQTLQILVYYLMGLRSLNPHFHRIKLIGLFNARLNTVDYIQVSELDPKMVEVVERYVIGYQV